MVPVFADLTLALPDIKITVLDVLVHGNMVGVRARVSGTQSGPLKGIPPTSKPIEFAIHSFHEFRDGRIAKTWHLEDWLSVFHQLGELPPSLKSNAERINQFSRSKDFSSGTTATGRARLVSTATIYCGRRAANSFLCQNHHSPLFSGQSNGRSPIAHSLGGSPSAVF